MTFVGTGVTAVYGHALCSNGLGEDRMLVNNEGFGGKAGTVRVHWVRPRFH